MSRTSAAWVDQPTPRLGEGSRRVARDRLELLAALVAGPRFDPLMHGEVLRFPPDHPTYRWRCLVAGCQRACAYSYFSNDLCHPHGKQWMAARGKGMNRPEFLLAAQPLELAHKVGQVACRICPQRPATSRQPGLCKRHVKRWKAARHEDPTAQLTQWCSGEVAYPGFGECLVVGCSDLAGSPLGLCRWHELTYERHDRPGGAAVAGNWIRWGDAVNREVVVSYHDVNGEERFQRWCALAPTPCTNGRLDLRGLRPVVREELRWGFFRHTEGDRSRWLLPTVQALINLCRGQQAGSLAELDLSTSPNTVKLIVSEMLHELRLVYFAPADTRDAGFLETEHFGVKFTGRAGHFNLTVVSQRWLRDLLWDFLADRLRSPKCPRSPSLFDRMRQACAELSAFLEADAPHGGHDPALLREEHVHRLVADQRHREHHQLRSLAIYRKNGEPSTVTARTRANTMGNVRLLLRASLDSGQADKIGLDRGFIVAVPQPAYPRARTRRPFPDHVANALAEETNLAWLAKNYDSKDVGLRDIWETLIATGRRLGEVVNLRLDCTSLHHGLPMLWHDQTKVGNYDEAIRIPDTVHELLAQRRRKTIGRFVQWHGRPPTATERATLALFPTRWRNRDGSKAISLSTFNRDFRDWVDELDLGGHYVSHQARHTLATNLLRHGAGLHHIRRYLGHVSDTMTEHYAKIALSEIEDVLQHVWVAGPGSPNPGEVLSHGITSMNRQQAQALALDLSRRATPAEGGFCTFQPVVAGNACPWNLDCHNCDKFVVSGADLLYWRRKREQWASIAERAPDDSTADYLHQVFEPTARAIDGLEKALAALGLLDEALKLDMRRPQDYFNRIWSTAFRAADLANHTAHEHTDDQVDDEAGKDT
jgi:integrase